MHPNLVQFLLNKEPWMSIKEPEQLQEKIMNTIGRNVYKKLYLLKFLKYIPIACFTLLLIITAGLVLNYIKPTTMVFIYPDSEKIKNVEVVGDFRKKHEKVKMHLDKEKGVWKGEVNTYKNNVDNYTINVDLEEPDSNGISAPEDTKSDDSVGI